MKTTTEIKQFFRTVMGIKVRAHTSAGKQHYQSVYIPPNPNPDFRAPLTWPAQFPEDFRRLCLKTIYPDSPTMCNQVSGGNVSADRIAMTPQEWETVILQHQMEKAIEEQDFEKAEGFRNLLRLINENFVVN